jgi:hypothetical protein
MFNPVLLERVFDLRRDGIVILKVLPEGPARRVHALRSLGLAITKSKKNMFLRPNSIGPPNNPESPSVALQKECAGNHRYMVQGGRGREAIIR